VAFNSKKTVWILGSGFSYSLGGPLLGDLFRMRAFADDQADYPEERFPGLAFELFESRCVFRAGVKDAMWKNAEDFLAYLDDAFEGSVSRRKKVLQLSDHVSREDSRKVVPGEPLGSTVAAFKQQGNVLVRRALAAECSTFLREIDPSDERWEPYKEWVMSLSPEYDTIITFNYDRALTLADRYAHGSSPHLKTLLPHECAPPPADRVPVLKLHGSVDWALDAAGGCSEADANALLAVPSCDIALAAPGRTKATSVAGYLRPLWHFARKRLEHASHIVLVGYSIPATDAMARMMLQQAIRVDAGGEQHRRVDIVMGPDTSRSEVRRVVSLLEACRGRRTLIVSPKELPAKCRSTTRLFYVAAQPLGAEDFIADYLDRLRDWEPLPETGGTVTFFPDR
jgi:hypothetical protein